MFERFAFQPSALAENLQQVSLETSAARTIFVVLLVTKVCLKIDWSWAKIFMTTSGFLEGL